MSFTTPPRWLLASIVALVAILSAITWAMDLKQQQLANPPLGPLDATARSRKARLSPLIQRCETALQSQRTPGLWERALRLRGLGPRASEADVAAVRQLLDLSVSELPAPIPLSYAEAPHLGLQLTLLETRFSAAARVEPTTPRAPIAETTAQLVWAARQLASDTSPPAHSELARRLTQGLQVLNDALRQTDVGAAQDAQTLMLAQAVFRAAPLVSDSSLETSVRHTFLSVLTQLPRFVDASAASAANGSAVAQCLQVERRALVVETLATYLTARATRPEPARVRLQAELDALLLELQAAGACERGQDHALARSAAAAGALRALRLSRQAL